MIAKRRYMRGLPPPASPLAPSGIPAPKAEASQAALRDRRRKRLPIHLTGTFNLPAEIEAVCARAAQEVSRLRDPRVMRRDIEAVVDAIHEIMSVVVAMLAESRSADPNVTRRLVGDLAIRPQIPEIPDTALVSGSWVSKLSDWTATYAGDLAALLGRALPPGHNGLKGSPSASERLERALRVMDSAVLDLERHIPRIAQRQSLPSVAEWNRQQRERRDAERAERVLAKLGVAK
ncbi:hypothetical protein P5V78_04375 [Mycobacteroides abscessus subsp. abscessus]|uniref:hypothetical protein n=1 Tax=Mycobacteroides abscessus TaxID=36809 RepID=UPI0009266ECC|nr:hypothetical protein [Mycobacteroides abscessus]MBN7403649.1 hypothetical protein [Mycobacteroides abscessus subsp. abscessus]MDO3087207.1 hypothetical protein [Mycobacteroides abscessus subsp. abscessus]MDO3269203.1 hypothetical protein [Mycobacteroides abscessus subsp. abscessus]SHP99326.1 Uncharacterised protein [Mycobacteroides abscessus subsp. abscessus]SHY42139.1 Uncharacterised protein [Mycobacteroides abscessus subsp. abscessus]